MTVPDPIAWLEAFADRVRARDLDGGRRFFAPGATGFGTRAARVDGLDDLVEQQWRPVWTSTRGFRFDVEDALVATAADGSQTTVAATWSSEGVTGDGTTFDRAGRATLVLVPDPGSPVGLVAVHSHFSEDPTG